MLSKTISTELQLFNVKLTYMVTDKHFNLHTLQGLPYQPTSSLSRIKKSFSNKILKTKWKVQKFNIVSYSILCSETDLIN